ncbi:MAG: substrate-binding domain-containing protein, partial [Ktedonobacterales bacterium]
EQLVAERVPFVLVNRHTDPITANAVVPDNYGGASAAVEHLLGLGHRRIAHIAGSDDVSTSYLRRAAYLDTLRVHGIATDPRLLVFGSFREQGGYDAMRALLDLPEPPTAVFAVNDLAALGALRAIASADLRAPEDISIVGFNDLFHIPYITPQLTTIQVPDRAMGARAVERLLDMIIAGVWPESPILLPLTLVTRASSGPPPTRKGPPPGRMGAAPQSPLRGR